MPDTSPKCQLVADGSLAVLLIDMQPRFVKMLDVLPRCLIVEQQIKIIRACATKDVPLLAVEHSVHGETLVLLQKEIVRVPRYFFYKKPDANAFESPEVEATVKSLKARTLLLMGLHGAACVLDTAEDAAHRGYRVVTATNLIDEFGKMMTYPRGSALYKSVGAHCYSEVEIL